MERYFKGCSIENLGLKGKTAIVTVGNSDLGKNYALALAKAGANLVIHTNDTKWDHIRTLIERENKEVIFVKGDLFNKNDRKLMINLALKVYGKIDILINNTEIDVNPYLFIKDSSYYHGLVRKNLAESYFLNEDIGEIMKSQNYGKIINVISKISNVADEEFKYEDTKQMEKITKKFAKELAVNNIQVNGIDKVEKGADPIDIARTIVFLASKLSDYINGMIVPFNEKFALQ